MSVTGFAAFRYTSLPGVHVGALALSVGVVCEAAASRMMTHRLVPELLGRPRAPEGMAGLSMSAITRFYTPLALTTLMALSIQPMVTFFMGQARFPLESLAVLPVIDGLTFIFRAIGLSYLEVAIALLGDRREHFARLRNFAAALAVGACGGLSAIVLTPLAEVWFQTVSGLSLTLTAFALLPAQIMAPFPILSVTLHTQRAVLVHAHRTRPITTATVAEVIVVRHRSRAGHPPVRLRRRRRRDYCHPHRARGRSRLALALLPQPAARGSHRRTSGIRRRRFAPPKARQ